MLMHRIRNRCGVQSQATPRRTSGGRAPVRVRVSRDCAHLAAPAKRRKHLRKKSRPRRSALRHHGTRRSPRPARLPSGTGSWRGQLESLAGTAHRSACPQESATKCVCFCLFLFARFRASLTRARGNVLFQRYDAPAGERDYRKIPRSTSHRPKQSPAGFFRSPQRRKVHVVVQGLASRAAARAEAA
jgi:hypothetical protein